MIILQKPKCSVEGCEKPKRTKDLCSTHYERLRRTGVIGGPEDGRKRPPKGICEVNECASQATNRSFCGKHYERNRTHGDPNFTQRPSYGSKRRTRNDGYVDLYLPQYPYSRSDGYIFEHRYVMHELGYNLKNMHVHHKNHDKQDNRPENLEIVSAEEHQKNHLYEGGWAKTNKEKTHCIRGHELSGDNLISSQLPNRGCKECRRIRDKERYRRRKTGLIN